MCTVGHTGIYACGNHVRLMFFRTMQWSLKQESLCFNYGECQDDCSSRKCLSEERKKYEILMDVVGSAIVISFFFMVTSIFYFNQFIERKLRYVVSIYETRTEYGTVHMDKGQCRCSVGMRKYG